MNNGGYKLIVIEGEVSEKILFDSVEAFFLKKDKLKYINLPAKQNIYMLWKILQTDDFQTDIVEILRDNVAGVENILAGISRDDIDEIFLFFDLDMHQNNLPKDVSAYKVISDMLNTFDNETEFGKLYISYPMIEAIRDLSLNGCHTYSGACVINTVNLTNYKNISGDNNPLAEIKKYSKETWQKIIEIFAHRVSCLFSLSEVITYDLYKKDVSPKKIYEKQKQNYLSDKIFILSAIPEFILDYFRIDFWKSWIKTKRFKLCNILKT